MTQEEINHEANRRFEIWWNAYQTDDMIPKDAAREIFVLAFAYGVDEGTYNG